MAWCSENQDFVTENLLPFAAYTVRIHVVQLIDAIRILNVHKRVSGEEEKHLSNYFHGRENVGV